MSEEARTKAEAYAASARVAANAAKAVTDAIFTMHLVTAIGLMVSLGFFIIGLVMLGFALTR